MSVKSIPENLEQFLPNPRTPWHVSPNIFPKLQFDVHQKDPYTKCQVTQEDPEWRFVVTYFNHDKPKNPQYQTIRRLFAVHNPASTGQFESKIPTMEQEATNPFFSPSWHKEDPVPLREKAFSRWQDSVQPFSPFFIQSAAGRKDMYKETKIVPLWHGSTAEKCESVCKTGFTFFGKHDPNDLSSTDIGFFGSGIYFTNSARYAADIYSSGHIMLAWVSMREPFPVVSQKITTPPNEPQDMALLKGKGAYKKYNAHYAPVISINPANSQCAIYYPCAKEQTPMCDEYVVFQPAQTLARFWLELGPDPLGTIPQEPGIQPPLLVSQMLDHILTLLDNTSIQQSQLMQPLEEKSHELLSLDSHAPVSQTNLEFYNCLQKLLSEAGQVRSVVAKKLLQLSPVKEPPAKKEEPQKITPIPKKIASPALPPLAFGAAKWKEYFGLDVKEPPLPADIHGILQGPCPIFAGKIVAETHFLTLIPEGLTLERLEQLTLNAKQGYKIGFRYKNDTTWKEYGQKPSGKSHWVLMTNDVIPNSRKKIWDDQKKLATPYEAQGYRLLSALDAATSILVEYVQTGRRFYSDAPDTYTRCTDLVSSQWPVAIGGFAPGGVVVSGYGVSACEDVGVSLARLFP